MKGIGKSSISSVLKVILDVAWYLSIAGISIAVILAAISLQSRGNLRGHLNIPVIVDVDPGVYSISAPDYGITSATLQDLSGDLHFRSPGGRMLLFFAAYIAAGFGILMVVLYQLRNIMATLAAGSPFVAANAGRIRFIGWTVIAGHLLQGFIEFIGQVVVKASFQATGITFGWTYHMSVQTLFWGFVILALAEVFRLGVELREDQSLTV